VDLHHLLLAGLPAHLCENVITVRRFHTASAPSRPTAWLPNVTLYRTRAIS
jgi:hypothetical protein